MTAATARSARANFRDSAMSPLFLATAFLLLAAGLFGGGGRNYPLGEMVVELAAIPALILALRNKAALENKRAYRVPILLFFALFLLFLLQIIPLPPAIWQALPGREPFVEVARLAGLTDSWQSWSIDPQTTVMSGLSLIVPFTVLLAMMRLDTPQIVRLVALVIIIAASNLLLGMMQLASGGQDFYMYRTSHMGLPLGLFANRNHIAIFMLVALVLSSALLTHPKSMRSGDQARAHLPGLALLGLMAAGIAFSFGILATNSRTVIALLVPTVLILIYLGMPAKHQKLAGLGAIGGTAILGGLLVWLASSRKSAIVNQLFERFGQSEDHRFEFWPDSLQAFWAYFPFGTGIGSFNIAFRPHETLDIVGSHYVNSAHNEYIEVGIETGIFGLAILLCFLGWLATRSIALVRTTNMGRDHWLGLHAAIALILLGLHSVVDYPARRLAVMAVCAMLVAMIARCKKLPVTKLSGKKAAES